MSNDTPTPMTPEEMIRELFNLYLEDGGSARVTQFKPFVNKLITKEIGPLCGYSGSHSSGADTSWRDDLKARFGGRGRKWCFVDSDYVIPYLDAFDKRGVSTHAYRAWIARFGRAWIRYTGPRIHQGKPSAAFELRTTGSTYDQPKELVYVAIDNLDSLELLNGTPYGYQLEFESPEPVDESIEESIEESIDESDDFLDDEEI